MKKLFVGCILISLLSMKTVSAKEEVYYGEYGPFHDWSMQKVEESDTVQVEHEKRYRWYYDEIAYGDYTLLGEVTDTYPYQDKKQTKKGSWSEWSTLRPEEVEKRQIEEKKMYRFRKMKPIRYIYFYHAQGTDGRLSIPEIRIYAKGKIIRYQASCDTCSSNLIEGIQDGNTKDLENEMMEDSTLTLDLKQEYAIDDIRVEIYLYDEGEIDKKLTYAFTDAKEESPRFFVYNPFLVEFTSKTKDDIYHNEFAVSALQGKDPKWEKFQYSEEEVRMTVTTEVQYGIFYRYRDTYYRQYMKTRHETEEYTKEKPEKYQYKIKDSYQEWYRYRTRDKVVLSGEWIITRDDFSIDSLIREKTRDVTFETNLNLTKNGVYDIIFDLGFQKVKKKIVVDILKNDQKQYRKVQEEIELLEQDIEEVSKLTDSKEKEEMLKELKEKAIQLYKQKTELKDKLSFSNQKMGIDSRMWWYVLFILLIFLIFYLAYRKYSYEKR